MIEVEPQKIILNEYEWVLRASDRRSKHVKVLYKGIEIPCTAIIVLGQLPGESKQ